MKLSIKDFNLLNHALDIMASDYDPDNKFHKDDPPDAYRVKMQKDIDKLRRKLSQVQQGEK